MTKKFRQFKYLNESGSQQGEWFINRLDYFTFHQYPSYFKHKYLSLTVTIAFIVLAIKLLKYSLWPALPCFYIAYISLRTFIILQRRICRYRGYFIYPKRFVKFFKDREQYPDLNDFDSIATIHKHDK